MGQADRARAGADPRDVRRASYPTSACGTGGARPTVGRILTPARQRGIADEISVAARIARATHRPAIVSESNSASCGGRPACPTRRRPACGPCAFRYVGAAGRVRAGALSSSGTSDDPLAFNADGTAHDAPAGYALMFLHRWIPVGSQVVDDREPVVGKRGGPMVQGRGGRADGRAARRLETRAARSPETRGPWASRNYRRRRSR